MAITPTNRYFFGHIRSEGGQVLRQRRVSAPVFASYQERFPRNRRRPCVKRPKLSHRTAALGDTQAFARFDAMQKSVYVISKVSGSDFAHAAIVPAVVPSIVKRTVPRNVSGHSK
jgi:hypothetical protein